MDWLQVILALFIIWIAYKVVCFIASRKEKRENQKILDLAKWVDDNLNYVFEHRSDEVEELEEWWDIISKRREKARKEALLSKYGE